MCNNLGTGHKVSAIWGRVIFGWAMKNSAPSSWGYEKNQVQAKHGGAIRKGPPLPLPVSQGASSGGQSKSLMDAPLIDFSGSEPPPSFSQVPSLANFQVTYKEPAEN